MIEVPSREVKQIGPIVPFPREGERFVGTARVLDGRSIKETAQEHIDNLRPLPTEEEIPLVKPPTTEENK